MAKQLNPQIETFARIKVVGVGGAGGAAVNRMIESGIGGVEFIVINTDAQALHHSEAAHKIHIGKETTRGLGAGADPRVGQKAAEESSDEIRAALEGADMIFITIGAGGGTGSGAGHVVAQIAQELGILVIGFATKPFMFEGDRRKRNADYAISHLSEHVDTLISIPNDRLLQTIDRKTPLLEAFKIADDVLRQGVQGISDLITVHGVINLDFADVQAVMKRSGSALMGIGRASGDDRAVAAAQQAIESPLLDVSIDGARGILFNVIGGEDMAMHEINSAAETITAAADPDANIIFGATINPDIEGEIIVTVVATGFDSSYFSGREAAQAIDEELESINQQKAQQKLAAAADKSLDEMARDIDTSLQDEGTINKEIVDTFKDDDSRPSMWDKEEVEKKDSKPKKKSDSDSDDSDDYDIPSFLRRLKRNKKDND